MASERSKETAGRIIDVMQDSRMGFAGGVSLLVIDVPPHWAAWLAGDVTVWRLGLWTAALAAVVRGGLWLAFSLAGKRVPKALKGDTETAKKGT